MIDDDPGFVSLVQPWVGSASIRSFSTAAEYLSSLAATSQGPTPDLILLDLCHDQDPQGEGTIQKIPEIISSAPDAELIIESGVSDLRRMRLCIQNGASQFFLKQTLSDDLPLVLERVREVRRYRKGMDQLLLGESSVMHSLKRELLSLRLDRRLDVLIEGETGSGKELCAQALHSDGPFIAVNVAALPHELFESEFFGSEKGAYSGSTQARAGYLEETRTGTLFLDEIQSMSLAHQAKLLRVFETRAWNRVGSTSLKNFSGRIVCATNRPLREAVEKGEFREDLYFRISQAFVEVPPLRQRGNDVVLLARHFLSSPDIRRRLLLTDEGAAILKAYEWPGNVRELKSMMRSVAARIRLPVLDSPEISQYLQKQDQEITTRVKSGELAGNRGVTFEIQSDHSFDENVALFEKHLLSQALKGISTADARTKLHLTRSRFYEKLKQYGLLK